MLAVAVAVVALYIVPGTRVVRGETDWDYTYNGNDWGGLCKTGKKQSPIDIITKWTEAKSDAPPFEFINYDQPSVVNIDEDHGSIYVRPIEFTAAIAGGGLRGVYVLQQVHFHWGSEHLINSQRYILEAHMVHYKEKYGSNTTAATQDPEGIAVLGILFCPGPKSLVMEKVIEGFDNKTILSYQDFLPEKLDFYRYYGSLTTPPCAEAVVWTVFKDKLTMTKQQLERLKNLKPSLPHTNYRVTQRLNNREVEKWQPSDGENKVGSLKSSTKLIVAAPLLARNVKSIL